MTTTKDTKAELVTRTPDAIAQPNVEAGHVLEAIVRAAADPTIDVGKLERLLGLQQTILSDQRRASFMAAMARVQEKMPRVTKTGVITDRDGNIRSRFAPLQDIDQVIRPLLQEEGFAFSFNSESSDAKTFQFSATLAHRDGHTETRHLPLPLDASQYRSPVQNVGSSLSYARRQLIKMFFNIIEINEDDDGLGGPQGYVTQVQADDIRSRLAEVKGDEAKFLRLLKAAKFEFIPAGEYERALNFIADKKRANERGAKP